MRSRGRHRHHRSNAASLGIPGYRLAAIWHAAPRQSNGSSAEQYHVEDQARGLGLGGPPTELETAALLLRGTAYGRRFHHQVTAAALAGSNPESNMWSMADIDVLDRLLANQDRDWVSITFRGIGEMEEQRILDNIDAARSWVELSSET